MPDLPPVPLHHDSSLKQIWTPSPKEPLKPVILLHNFWSRIYFTTEFKEQGSALPSLCVSFSEPRLPFMTSSSLLLSIGISSNHSGPSIMHGSLSVSAPVFAVTSAVSQCLYTECQELSLVLHRHLLLSFESVKSVSI